MEIREIKTTLTNEGRMLYSLHNEGIDNNIIENEIKNEDRVLDLYVPYKEYPNSTKLELIDYDKYSTRDISWVDFNERVLDLALDTSMPILERMKFLAISNSNLDEFIMVRMGMMLEDIQNKENSKNINGLTPKEEYKVIEEKVEAFINRQYNVFNQLNKELIENDIKFIYKPDKLSKKIKKSVNKYFSDKLLSLITPTMFDSSRPFPLIRTKNINIGVICSDEHGNTMYGTIIVPDFVDRIISVKVKDETAKHHIYMLVEDVIIANLDKIFINKNIISYCTYKLLRNYGGYDIPFNENDFIAEQVTANLKRKEMGNVVKLEISGGNKEIHKVLSKVLNVDKEDVIKVNGPVDLTYGLSKLPGLNSEFEKTLYFEPFKPAISSEVAGVDIFSAMEKEDIVLHHPYDSYKSVVDFIEQSADNPEVVTIKQTLYRLSNNSPIMNALIRAAEKGKQVVVLLEVKARFDEKNNIAWANKLERAGGHVIYGVDELKTHSKMTLIVKCSKKGNLKNYVHLGTGNYNDKSAKMYTDLSLFTTDDDITSDVVKLFNAFTGFSEPKLKKVISAPFHLRPSLNNLIDKEIKIAKSGKFAEIIIKVNALTDKQLIDKLYEASQAGVRVKLLVRGACCLVPGIPGLSHNITVKSVLGRFLEHSRIYMFKNDTGCKMYLASADMMPRNLDRRIETMFPVNSHTKEKVCKILNTYFENNKNCYDLSINGYRKLEGEYSPQDIFIKESLESSKIKNINKIYFRMKK